MSLRPSLRFFLLAGFALTLIGCGGVNPIGPATPSTPRVTPSPTVAPTSTTSASSTPSSGSYLSAWPLPPLCPLSAAGARVCQAPLAGGNRQASGGESILFRIGWSDASEQSCNAYAGNTTIRITVDGQTESFVTVPCQFFTASPFPSDGDTDQWVTDARYLSPPLSPGSHPASVTITYNAPVPYTSGCTKAPCSIASGTVQPFHITVTVG